MVRFGIALMFVLLAGCGTSSETPSFDGERSADTTTAPVEQEGYTSALAPVDWLLVGREDDHLEVVATGGGCSDFNGYRLRQSPTEVQVEVVNTVLTSAGPSYGCNLNLTFNKHRIDLPEKLGEAEVTGGCAPDPVVGEGRYCDNLRQIAERFK